MLHKSIILTQIQLKLLGEQLRKRYSEKSQGNCPSWLHFGMQLRQVHVRVSDVVHNGIVPSTDALPFCTIAIQGGLCWFVGIDQRVQDNH